MRERAHARAGFADGWSSLTNCPGLASFLPALSFSVLPTPSLEVIKLNGLFYCSQSTLFLITSKHFNLFLLSFRPSLICSCVCVGVRARSPQVIFTGMIVAAEEGLDTLDLAKYLHVLCNSQYVLSRHSIQLGTGESDYSCY